MVIRHVAKPYKTNGKWGLHNPPKGSLKGFLRVTGENCLPPPHDRRKLLGGGVAGDVPPPQ